MPINNKISFLKIYMVLLVSIPLILLASCGFKPLYSQNDNIIGNLKISPAEGRLGYLIEQELKRKVGPLKNTNNTQVLNLKIVKTIENSSLKVDYYTSRATIIANVSYEFLKYDGNSIKGIISARAGFDAIDKAYSEVSLTADTEERLAKEIADKLWQDLLINTRK